VQLSAVATCPSTCGRFVLATDVHTAATRKDCAHLPQHHAEAVDISRLGQPPLRQQLRRHVRHLRSWRQEAADADAHCARIVTALISHGWCGSSSDQGGPGILLAGGVGARVSKPRGPPCRTCWYRGSTRCALSGSAQSPTPAQKRKLASAQHLLLAQGGHPAADCTPSGTLHTCVHRVGTNPKPATQCSNSC
jgi:hypothetical protein